MTGNCVSRSSKVHESETCTCWTYGLLHGFVMTWLVRCDSRCESGGSLNGDRKCCNIRPIRAMLQDESNRSTATAYYENLTSLAHTVFLSLSLFFLFLSFLFLFNGGNGIKQRHTIKSYKFQFRMLLHLTIIDTLGFSLW